MNQFIGVGNLGADAEVREMSNGDKVANLRMALTERYTDRQGQKQEKTTWITVSVFGPQAERVADAKKGWKCFVVGRLQQRSWTDREGQEHQAWEVVVSHYPSTQIEVFPLGQHTGQRAGQQPASTRSPASRAPSRASVPSRAELAQKTKPDFPVTADDLNDDVPW